MDNSDTIRWVRDMRIDRHAGSRVGPGRGLVGRDCGIRRLRHAEHRASGTQRHTKLNESLTRACTESHAGAG